MALSLDLEIGRKYFTVLFYDDITLDNKQKVFFGIGEFL